MTQFCCADSCIRGRMQSAAPTPPVFGAGPLPRRGHFPPLCRSFKIECIRRDAGLGCVPKHGPAFWKGEAPKRRIWEHGPNGPSPGTHTQKKRRTGNHLPPPLGLLSFLLKPPAHGSQGSFRGPFQLDPQMLPKSSGDMSGPAARSPKQVSLLGHIARLPLFDRNSKDY